MNQPNLFQYSETYYEIHAYLIEVCGYPDSAAHEYIVDAMPRVLGEFFVPSEVVELDYDENS